MRHFASITLPIQAGIFCLALAGAARADDLPQGTAPQAPASKGTTDLTAQKFETATKDDPAKAKDATELAVGAGGLSSTGSESASSSGLEGCRRCTRRSTATVAASRSRC